MSEFVKRLDDLVYNSKTGGGDKLFSGNKLHGVFGDWHSPDEFADLKHKNKHATKHNEILVGKIDDLEKENYELKKAVRDLEEKNLFLQDAKKPLVEVPQFVADWLELQKAERSLRGTMIDSELLISDKLLEWFRPWDNHEVFARAWLDGYTVKQEKLYYLKNRVTNKYLMEHKVDFCFGEDESKEESSHWKTRFNQSEINAIEWNGSYEQIEVVE